MSSSSKSQKKQSKSKSHKNSSASEAEEESLQLYDNNSLSNSLNQSQSGLSRLASRNSLTSERSTNSLKSKNKQKKTDEIEMGIRNIEILDEGAAIHTVEVLKRPGQTLGFYIREGNGKGVKSGVFISRIAEGSIIQRNGLLKVGDEIQAINSVNVTRSNLDDVVVLMSIPKKLILTVKASRKLLHKSPSHQNEIKPVYVHPRSEESELKLTADLNPEDSNDSGLSSEHSLRVARQPYERPTAEQHYANLPHPSTFGTKGSVQKQVTFEHVYDKPSSNRPFQTDLHVSDGEQEYTPVPRLRSSKRDDDIIKNSKHFSGHYSKNGADSYNSDSELVTGKANTLPAHFTQWDHTDNQNSNIQSQQTSVRSLNEYTSEMHHWLRKFDHMSQEYNSLKGEPEKGYLSTAEELDSYKNELWRQEQLLNKAIHNMESALHVDTMLQSSANTSATLPRTASAARAEVSKGQLTGAAYSYLRDLPSLIRTPLRICIEDFILYKPDTQKALPHEAMSEGLMRIRLYSGHGLKSSRTSLRDLYCVFQLDNIKLTKTKIRAGAINFDWDETFDIRIENGSANLICMIYNWDPHVRHRLCFTGTIKLSHFFNSNFNYPQNKKCALKLEPRGILYIELGYCSQRNSESGSNLFGHPLKEINLREETGVGIPLIITKCVSEVNSRGLGVVGIYRLCGAAKKKQQLRVEFENYPHLVDLSPRNVPEIHAITGLLKDYLRELPDSLLSLHAYNTAERSLMHENTKCAGKQSLEIINEFVAYLEPWQQGTVIYLLNHLKLITLHQAENRMNAANLAVCFGPVFNLPKHEQEGDKDSSDTDSMRLHNDIIRFLIEIWPLNYNTNNNVVV